jgi:uncharacterized protein YqjF (DUF2071 family)
MGRQTAADAAAIGRGAELSPGLHAMRFDFLAERTHRPLPWPSGPWVLRMAWHRLLFAHFEAPAAALASGLPRGLELDTFEGRAYLGVVPFEMRSVGPWRLPGLPGTRRFLELNLRTYVRCQGVPGVWFFSLDAESRVAVRGARALFHLPYFDARMSLVPDARGCLYSSERIHRGAAPARLALRYGPSADQSARRWPAFERWATERYTLFSADGRGRLYRGDIHHRPWPLQAAWAEFESNSLASGLGLALDQAPASLLYAHDLDVVAWPLRPVASVERARVGRP